MTPVLASPTLHRPSAIGASDTRLHPLVALRAARSLIRNPADTRQVFVVLRALRGRSTERALARLAADPTGQAILRTRPDLAAHLSDTAARARLPATSLGRAYLRFMADSGLDAAGLLAAQRAVQHADASAFDDATFLRGRLRDLHDLLHVVTGYPPDPLGELCLLAFNHAQTGQPGMALIVLMGCLRAGGGPTGRLVRQQVVRAWRRGRAAAWLPGVDWEASLDQPLVTLQVQLRLADEPTGKGAAA